MKPCAATAAGHRSDAGPQLDHHPIRLSGCLGEHGFRIRIDELNPWHELLPLKRRLLCIHSDVIILSTNPVLACLTELCNLPNLPTERGWTHRFQSVTFGSSNWLRFNKREVGYEECFAWFGIDGGSEPDRPCRKCRSSQVTRIEWLVRLCGLSSDECVLWFLCILRHCGTCLLPLLRFCRIA